MLDLSVWPLVRLIFPDNVTDAVIEELGGELQTVLRRGERFAMVIDGSRVFSLTPKQRKMIVKSIEENTNDMKRFCVGQAVVVKSALSRGVITALTWLREPPVPLKVFDDMPAADAWLKTLLT